MFGALFGSKKPKQTAPTSDLNTSIQQLRSAVELLEKREAHLEKKVQQCLMIAKEKSKRRDKKGALFELKKKKQLETQLQSLQGKKLNLETQIMTLEDAHLNTQTLKAMRTSANAMRATVKEADLDKADDLMEQINEAMDQVQEMNEAMSQPIGHAIDDAELEAELAELEELEADELINAMPNTENRQQQKISSKQQTTVDLPNVPNKKIVAKQEDDELAQLEQLMN